MELATAARQHVLRMAHRAQGPHLGPSLSCIEILASVYAIAKVKPKEPNWPDRDRVILSKGHAAMALYAVLAERGFFPVSELETYGKEGSRLLGHPDEGVPGVDAPTGSLGHGLSVACGIALAARSESRFSRTYVIMGDGECNEGSVWEAAMFAAHHGLGSVRLVVDRNGQQACGETEDVLRLEPFADKWRAFGWTVEQVNGNRVADLCEALESVTLGPKVILARTVKGQGVPFMAGDLTWHYRAPNEAELARALAT